MDAVRTSSRRFGTLLPSLAAAGVCAALAASAAQGSSPAATPRASTAPATAAKPAATPTPRVLVRNPVGVPAVHQAEVLGVLAAALREAGAASVSVADFARVVEARADVKVVLTGAREKAKTGAQLDRDRQHSDAVRSFEGAVEDFEFVGADVWLPDEVGRTYIALGFARWHRDLEQGAKVPGKTTIAAWKRGRELAPEVVPAPPAHAPADVEVFRKAAGGAPAAPAQPGEGLFSLGRLLGLDGVVETRASKAGALQLRAHKIETATVKTFTVTSRARGLDPPSRKELAAGFAFPGGPLPPLVATAATPAPTAVAVASPAATPAPTGTPAPFATAQPTPSAVAAITPPPAPTPVAVAVATPAPTPKQANGNGNGRTNGAARPPAPTPTPVVLDPSVAPAAPSGPPTRFAGSYAQLAGGADHRAALYTNESAFASAPSGTSPAGWSRVWYVLRDVWAVSASAGGLQRVYRLGEGGAMKSATGQEVAIHGLRSDDARGRWWIGAGLAYTREPRVTGPGGFPEVPQVSRLVPSAVGVAHYPISQRLALRGRALAGVALEGGKSATTRDRSGVGYDVRVEGSAVIALTRTLRLATGAGGERVFTDFGDQTTGVEARRTFWLGVEAGF